MAWAAAAAAPVVVPLFEIEADDASYERDSIDLATWCAKLAVADPKNSSRDSISTGTVAEGESACARSAITYSANSEGPASVIGISVEVSHARSWGSCSGATSIVRC